MEKISSSPRRSETDAVLLRQFCQGNQDAATALFHRYAHRLAAFAKWQCSVGLSARLDVDDIVQSVFCSFFHDAAQGRFHLEESEQLWKLLVVITLNNIRSAGEYHRAAKRDIRITRAGIGRRSEKILVERNEPARNELRLLLKDLVEQLPPAEQQIVQLRFQAYEVAEIVQQTGQSRRSVERALQKFRKRLQAQCS